MASRVSSLFLSPPQRMSPFSFGVRPISLRKACHVTSRVTWVNQISEAPSEPGPYNALLVHPNNVNWRHSHSRSFLLLENEEKRNSGPVTRESVCDAGDTDLPLPPAPIHPIELPHCVLQLL